jgi:hypothetical protein
MQTDSHIVSHQWLIFYFYPNLSFLYEAGKGLLILAIWGMGRLQKKLGPLSSLLLLFQLRLTMLTLPIKSTGYL